MKKVFSVFVDTKEKPESAMLGRRSFLWAMGTLCKTEGVPFSGELASKAYPADVSVAEMVTAAKEFGLMLAPVKNPVGTIDDGRPVLMGIQSQNGLTTGLVFKADTAQLVVVEAGANEPRPLAQDELALAVKRRMVWVARPLVVEPNGEARQPFGLAWFAKEIATHKKVWGDVLSASLLLQVVGLCLPLMTQAIIDKVIVNHAQSTLISLGVGLAMFYLFSTVLTWSRQYIVLKVGTLIDGELGRRVFEHLIRLPLEYFHLRTTGTLTSRLHGIETIRNFITGAFLLLVLDIPFAFVFLCLMCTYSIKLTLVTLAFAGVMAGLSFLVGPVLRARANQEYLLAAKNQGYVTEILGGVETVKSLQMEPRVASRFRQQQQAHLAAAQHTRMLSINYSSAMTLLEQLMSLSILSLGAWLAMTDAEFTIGMLIAYQMFASKVSQPLLKLSGMWQELQQTQIAIKRLADVMDCPAEAVALIPTSAKAGPGRLDIEGLGFKYSPNLPPLYKDFSFRLEPNEVVVLMGPSGSGKSTIAKLMQGMYLEYEGRIAVDGRDIRTLPVNELRGYFGVVPQDTVLFAGTVYDNLIAACPHATMSEVVEACKLAAIHTVIEGLDQGYQTQIGERGAGLSGGQRQRLAIARTLLKRPKVLIFDEATSGLDTENAEAVASTINFLKRHVSVLFIAHKIPPNLQANRVVHLNG